MRNNVRVGIVPEPSDVVAVLVAVLDAPSVIRRAFDIIGGDTPVADAVRVV